LEVEVGARTFVVGVGMTRFEKPGRREWDYPDMGREAGEKALVDAGIPYSAVEQAFVAYCYGDSTSGQRALYELGLTGIPAINVNNNCSTGSSALFLARKFVQGGVADCVLALGFEKMESGSLKGHFNDRTNPMDKHFKDMKARRGIVSAPPAAQIFGNAGREYMERFGVTAETFAKIGEKNHRHSVNNPYSQFRDEYSLADILAAPMVYDPLTRLQCCPTSDGGAAVVVASERFVKQHGLEAKAVEIVGQAMTTDFDNNFDGSDMSVAGYHMTEAAARAAYEESGLGPEDAQVVELHDCFSANELITYQGLGLCGEGKAGVLIDEGAVTYGGQWVVNPSGGLISKGHPLGATGLAQCSELTWQLRGEAEARQVEGATVGIQHNLGLGGAAVVTVYQKEQVSL
jgi:acetyl-CoA acetyltransferase